MVMRQSNIYSHVDIGLRETCTNETCIRVFIVALLIT